MSVETAHLRAEILRRIRDFFYSRKVLEVQTPALSRGACPDRYIDIFAALALDLEDRVPHTPRYLQTSPEMHMKRLLAAGYPDIYQICHAFRAGECGRHHNPEFTILEWYRRGFSLPQIMQETVDLCAAVAGHRPSLFLNYRDIVREHTGLDPLNTDLNTVQLWLRSHDSAAPECPTLADAFQYVMTRFVEPHLPHDSYVCIFHYPADQAVLATLDNDDPRVARRFELYGGGMELANGWEELREPEENARRFSAENAHRIALGKKTVPLQPGFLDALRAGLPSCAGVALGVDRLVMIAARAASIEDVLTFPWVRA